MTPIPVNAPKNVVVVRLATNVQDDVVAVRQWSERRAYLAKGHCGDGADGAVEREDCVFVSSCRYQAQQIRVGYRRRRRL